MWFTDFWIVWVQRNKQQPKKTTYIVSFSNRSNPKPFNNAHVRVVSSSSTSFTHSQVNSLVIKSTPMYLLPKESGLIMKMNASNFSLFTADQALLLPMLIWVDQYTMSFEWRLGFQILRPQELEDLAGGSGAGCIWPVSSSFQPELLLGKVAATQHL